MTWFGWTLIAMLVINPLCNILLIGQERKPYTPATALGSLVLAALSIVGILAVGTGHL